MSKTIGRICFFFVDGTALVAASFDMQLSPIRSRAKQRVSPISLLVSFRRTEWSVLRSAFSRSVLKLSTTG